MRGSEPDVRHSFVGFPVVTLTPGEQREVKADVHRVFRAKKLVMEGFMEEIRGRYGIKRARLPPLDRDDVIASSRIYRCRRGKKVWFRRGKTMVELTRAVWDEKRLRWVRPFVREYLSSSVVYHHIDPLEYIVLRQMRFGEEDGMPLGGGASARFFNPNALGNGISAPTLEPSSSLSLVLENVGDIDVRVSACVFGIEQVP